MSTSLYYRIPIKDHYLGYQLKWALARRFWGHDGSLSGDWITLDYDIIPFLEGVASGYPHAEDDVIKLIRLIREFDKVEVCLR